jgi:ubiquinone/menaquinone biosynthesis C-methylase UbiE
MAVELTSREISEKYDRFARWYDWFESVPDLLGVRRLRSGLLQRASGSVLEIAAGTGKNLAYHPADCRIVALDLSQEMLKVARSRAAKLSRDVLFLVADADALPFRDNRFDTIVSSLSICTFPNPLAALREVRRVCRSEGRVLLLEHGRSNREGLGRWQDRHADWFAKPLGCHWNREPCELVQRAGMKVISACRSFFGIFHQIEAEPARSSVTR